MVLRTIILPIALTLSSLLPAQQLLDLSAMQLDVGEFPYQLRNVYHDSDSMDCVGFDKVDLRNQWVPLYFDQGKGTELKSLISTTDSELPEARQYSIRINKFFLSQNSSPLVPKCCTFDFNLDFILHSESGDMLAYSECGSITCERKSEHPLDEDLISTALQSSLQNFAQSIQDGTSLDIPWKEELIENTSTILSALDRPDVTRHGNGVFHSFNDFCNGVLDTTNIPRIKKEFKSHECKIEFEQDAPEDIYAYQIEESIYVDIDGNGIRLIETGTEIQTTLYIPDPYDNERITNQIVMMSILTGVIGASVYGITASLMQEYVPLELEIDPMTGAVQLLGIDKISMLEKEVIVYHTHFSKADQLTIHMDGKSIDLLHDQYVSLRFLPERNGKKIFIKESEHEIVLTDFKLNANTERFLVKRKKHELNSQILTTYVFDDLKKEEVKFPEN